MNFIKWLFSSWSNAWFLFYCGVMLRLIVAVIIDPGGTLNLGVTPWEIIVLVAITVVGGTFLATRKIIEDYKGI